MISLKFLAWYFLGKLFPHPIKRHIVLIVCKFLVPVNEEKEMQCKLLYVSTEYDCIRLNCF